MLLKVPPHVSSVSVAGREYKANNGIIDVENMADAEIDKLVAHAHCHRAGPADVAAAKAEAEARAEADAEVAAEAKEKADVITELAGFGLRADGRLSLEKLKAKLAHAKANPPTAIKP